MFVDRHRAAVRVLPVRFPMILTHQAPLFSISIIFHNNLNLAPLTRPFSLRLLRRLFNFQLAFTTKRQNPRAQVAQILFVPTHDLFAPYADRLRGASCFLPLASCFDLFGWAVYVLPRCAYGGGRNYVAGMPRPCWIERRPGSGRGWGCGGRGDSVPLAPLPV